MAIRAAAWDAPIPSQAGLKGLSKRTAAPNRAFFTGDLKALDDLLILAG